MTPIRFETEVLRVFEHFWPDGTNFGWFIELDVLEDCLRMGDNRPDLKVGDKLMVCISQKESGEMA